MLLSCLEANKDKISEKCRKVIAEADEAPSPASAQKKDTPAEPAASAEKKKKKRKAELAEIEPGFGEQRVARDRHAAIVTGVAGAVECEHGIWRPRPLL